MTAINSRLITLDPVSYPGKDIIVDVLRLDKIHPVISGNKWYKLRFYLKQAIEQHKKTICTFGGAWSNHIVATAAACAENGLQSIGIIRGEKTGCAFQYAAGSYWIRDAIVFYQPGRFQE
ncbi:MAG: hypothetical protein IPP73_07140 [Chitinophagaceae bacterium]|nr:hypothetical protein [Chitinophagaceae bacterium]